MMNFRSSIKSPWRTTLAIAAAAVQTWPGSIPAWPALHAAEAAVNAPSASAQGQTKTPTSTVATDSGQALERTCFQTGGAWQPKVDIKSDVAVVYGFQGDLDGRIKGWRDHGYLIHFMTGVAWGNYQDYFSGKWDGTSHEDEAQTDRRGRPILHGPTVPYVAPSESYGKYLCVGVQKALDAGVEAIHLEEPEFWVNGGYSGSFKRAWREYYHEGWLPPHTTPDAQYRASKLKYFLYRRALQQVFDHVLEYNRKTGRNVRCYVPTHSLINYAHWKIVSPEQSLVLLNGCDGYIGQVWTGTARTANRYQGKLKERTFETAFCEYGVLQNLVRSTGRRMYYLNDPVEDNPEHSWEDYRRNWESTLVASLLWPDVWRYEVAPWPERPFIHHYPVRDITARKPGEPVEKVGISPAYATELLTVFNALNDLRQPQVEWECGPTGVGILVSDTMMFQRGEPTPSDPHLSSFYGLALPLIKSGVPVQPVQYENIGLAGFLAPFKVLFLTYEGQKPPLPQLHAQLAGWVKAGGTLVFVDDDQDPYNSVKEWWNTGDLTYLNPRRHLFEQLGLGPETAPGRHALGAGQILYRTASPAALSKFASGAEEVLDLARQACQSANLAWTPRNHLLLRRGPYVIAAGLDESPADQIRQLNGRLVNLFDPALAISTSLSITAGARLFLLDLDRVPPGQPLVLASAAKITGFACTAESSRPAAGQAAGLNTIRFLAAGPADTLAATRLRLNRAPQSVRILNSAASATQEWDEASHSLLLRYPNSTAGHQFEIVF